jgi:hypothetical protein
MENLRKLQRESYKDNELHLAGADSAKMEENGK